MKLAILDLGTNTFHLLIAEVGKDKSVRIVFRSKISVKLGEGAIDRNFIAPAPLERGLKALKHYAEIIRKHKTEKIFAIATSAVRSAINGKEFIRKAYVNTGIRINAISGEQEAELIYYGVRQCVQMSDDAQLIVDIGGGSTEFIIANRDRIYWKRSFNIGASRLLETFKPSDPITAAEIRNVELHLEKTLLPLTKALEKFPVKSLIGSSGSFDTLAEIIGWRFHRKNILKNAVTIRFDLNEVERIHRVLLNSTTAQRMKMKGLIKMRVDMIVLSSICTNFLLKKFKLTEMLLSKYALKEGVLWEAVYH